MARAQGTDPGAKRTSPLRAGTAGAKPRPAAAGRGSQVVFGRDAELASASEKLAGGQRPAIPTQGGGQGAWESQTSRGPRRPRAAGGGGLAVVTSFSWATRVSSLPARDSATKWWPKARWERPRGCVASRWSRHASAARSANPGRRFSQKTDLGCASVRLGPHTKVGCLLAQTSKKHPSKHRVARYTVYELN